MVTFATKRDINILVADDPADWVRGFFENLYGGSSGVGQSSQKWPQEKDGSGDEREALPWVSADRDVREPEGRGGGPVRVFVAGSEQEGFEIVRRERVDLALVAGDNPRLGGLALVRRMHVWSRRLPVIVIGGQGDPRWLREALGVGVTTVLPRPVNVSQLVSVSVKILGV